MAVRKMSPRGKHQHVPNDAQRFIKRLCRKVKGVKDEVDQIDKELAEINNLIDELNKQYDVIRSYWEEIQATNTLSEEMILLIKRALRHSWRVARISRWGLKAVKSLVIDVKAMYEANVETRDLVQDLVSRIDALHIQDLNPEESIYGLLNEFKAEVISGVVKTNTAVNDTLAVLESMEVLDNALRDRANGIRRKLRDMLVHLKQGKRPGLEDPELPEYGPIPTFPLTDCDDDYYDRLKTKAEQFEGDIEDLETQQQSRLDEKVRLESKFNTIKKGVEAAAEASGIEEPCDGLLAS